MKCLSVLQLSGNFKASLKKLEIPDNLHSELDKRTISILSIQKEHLDILLNLPHHYGDPFDRLNIAQSISEDLPLISYDSYFKKYQVELV
ncbi:PIN domain-containing protein [Rhodohalobacter sulfatireducens]|uniref:PIN domain-containing protein n=1 Tax=Rhodohalobacter sulfatireducens TaxID=2911366 RepID=UPI0034E2B1C2